MLRLAIALSALIAPAPSFADDLARFAGKYVGCAVSGEEWVPIATTLAADGGTLSGTYVFIETPDRWIPGSLGFETLEAENRITFTWSDIYGAGPASFTFSADGARFDGFWSGDSQHSFPWNGVRTGSGRPLPDCTVPVS